MTQSPSPFKVPASPGRFWIRQDHWELLSLVQAWTSKGEIWNVLLRGPQGTGKSTIPVLYASHFRRPLVVLEVGLLSDPGQLFGGLVLRNGETEFRPGLFTRAIQTPGCVVHLQELNRPENDRSLNAIFSVLDPNQRRVWVDDLAGYVKVAPGVTFFASLNEGYEFVGAMPLDLALEDRFQVKLLLGQLPADAELALMMAEGLAPEGAKDLAEIFATLRGASDSPQEISTRAVKQIAFMVARGVPEPVALETVLAVDPDRLESIYQTLHFRGREDRVRGTQYLEVG